jgi:hypothetical protein
MNEESLFAAALQKSDSAERAAFLAQACGSRTANDRGEPHPTLMRSHLVLPARISLCQPSRELNKPRCPNRIIPHPPHVVGEGRRDSSIRALTLFVLRP